MSAGPGLIERRFTALGGECELFAVGAGPDALAAAEAHAHRLHDRLTRFEPSSEVSRLNASAGSWLDVSGELEALLRFSLDAFDLSGGLVHIGVLPALRAAGYTRDFAAGPTAPGRATGAIPALPDLLRVEPGRARLAFGAAIDLGGVAKGWLADRLCERIGPNCLANLAGDLFARGRGPGGDGWPVGFGEQTVLLQDHGAATSGVTKRHWGDGLHHLIDPRTGWPAATGLREVSVLAHTGAQAEVLAKAAFLLGRDAAPPWLETRALGWWLE